MDVWGCVFSSAASFGLESFMDMDVCFSSSNLYDKHGCRDMCTGTCVRNNVVGMCVSPSKETTPARLPLERIQSTCSNRIGRDCPVS